MLMLRFRDLTIPDGETIRRHQAIIETEGAVWWGWIMRQNEVFPGEYIVALSRRLASAGREHIMLYHSGSGQFFSAELDRISALPGGQRIRSPQMDLTPPYMHESVCPAWFELREVHEIEPHPQVKVLGMPTLRDPSRLGRIMAEGGVADDELLRTSGATLWDIEATG